MVGVVNTSVTDQELRQMHDAGVRGIRFNLSPPGATTLDMIEPLAKRIEPMGWHCQINAPADQIVAAQEIFLRVPGRLVFDHLAHAPDVDSPLYQLVRRLLDKGNTWVKLSGAYRTASRGRPSMPIVSQSRRATPAPRRSAWCGAVTGRIRAKRRTRSRTMRCCSICWRYGCRTRRRGIGCWSRTRPSCTTFRAAEDPGRKRSGRALHIYVVIPAEGGTLGLGPRLSRG